MERDSKPTLTEEVHQAAILDFPQMLSEGRVHWGEEIRAQHGVDETEDLVFLPDVVLEPESTMNTRRGRSATIEGPHTGTSVS